MKASIIAEGRSDLAVLRNILKGALGIHQSDVQFDVPEFEFDQTDLAQMDTESFSNWTIVKRTCCERIKIDLFLEINPEAIVILQIDTAERIEKEYDVIDPQKPKADIPEYSNQLRLNVISKINEWIGDPIPDRIAYAISVEEIEAWLLALEGNKYTEIYNDPKAVLLKLLNRNLPAKAKKELFNMKLFAQYDQLSKPLSKHKYLLRACESNKSLQNFCDDLYRLGNGEVVPENR